MSNSTRPGGYDERLVVPLEASRRGAHRARVNRLVAALPLLAVVVVVAAVIGVAYTLFLKSSNNADTGAQSLPTVSSPPPTASSPAGVAPSASSGAVSSTSSSPSSSASVSATGTPDRTAAVRVFNGSVNHVSGLAGGVGGALKAAGWTGVQVISGDPPVSRNQSTRVYYANPSQRATAEALQKALKVGVVKQSATIANQGIVVVVGDDYRG